MLGSLRDRRLLWPALMTLAGIALGIALGTWQLRRLAWKNELISTIEARTGIAALPPEAWPNLKCQTVEEVGLELSCEYMRVTLRGTFDHTRERHVFISVPVQPDGVGGPGYWVFTPLALAGGRGVVAVNRGFVPQAAKLPLPRQQGQVSGEVLVTGLLRSGEPRGRFSGKNDAAQNVWFVRSPAELYGGNIGSSGSQPSDTAGPDPVRFYIDQTSPPPPGGLPLPLAGRIELPNRHLEYALTWFALAATLAAVFGAYCLSNWKK